MLDNIQEFEEIVNTVIEIAKVNGSDIAATLLANGKVTIEQTDFDNWNGGTYGYTVYVVVDIDLYAKIQSKIHEIERDLVAKFNLPTRHLIGESINSVMLIPSASKAVKSTPNPHRPFSEAEAKRRTLLVNYLNSVSEDDLIEFVLLPLFRQLGFHRITSAGHKDKAMEYGKDIWMKFTLPTQHILYFGIQAKKSKIDSAGASKANIAEIYNQLTMMLGHEIFDPEIGKRVLVDHAFIVAGGEITKAARNWLGGKLDASKRSQVMFLDREDILNLYVVNNLPLPEKAIIPKTSIIDDLPF